MTNDKKRAQPPRIPRREEDNETVDRARPSALDRDEMVETVRMDYDDIHENTQPLQPTLSTVTKRRKVPTPLLEMSKRPDEEPDHEADASAELFVFRAAPDGQMRIQVPANLQDRLEPGQMVSVWLKLPNKKG